MTTTLKSHKQILLNYKEFTASNKITAYDREKSIIFKVETEEVQEREKSIIFKVETEEVQEKIKNMHKRVILSYKKLSARKKMTTYDGHYAYQYNFIDRKERKINQIVNARHALHMTDTYRTKINKFIKYMPKKEELLVSIYYNVDDFEIKIMIHTPVPIIDILQPYFYCKQEKTSIHKEYITADNIAGCNNFITMNWSTFHKVTKSLPKNSSSWIIKKDKLGKYLELSCNRSRARVYDRGRKKGCVS